MPLELPARWYDGASAVRHDGTLVFDGGDTVRLAGAAGDWDVPLARLVFAEARGGEVVYGWDAQPGFRLILSDPPPPALAAHLPRRQTYGSWVDRLGLGRAAALFAVASAGAVALFLTAPAWLGPRIPYGWEQRLGQAMVGDFGGRLCSTPEGDRALAKLLGQLDPDARSIRAGIANTDMVNAVALPGGQVLLFDGLVQDAETPEELAGVLGHEIGHVRERHVMTALMRQFGLSILLSGASSGLGDTVAGLTAMSYGRDAEREADAYARTRMAEADISPLGAARFFERLGGIDAPRGDGALDDADGADGADAEESAADPFGWIASHPGPRERARAFRTAYRRDETYRPPLTPQEFAALKAMCRNDPDVESFGF